MQQCIINSCNPKAVDGRNRNREKRFPFNRQRISRNPYRHGTPHNFRKPMVDKAINAKRLPTEDSAAGVNLWAGWENNQRLKLPEANPLRNDSLFSNPSISY